MSADARRRTVAGAWSLAVAFGAAAMLIAGYAAHTLPGPRPLEELSYYPSGRSLEPATLGHAESAADLAWLRAVQYYGHHRMTDNRFERMGHVFDILTTLSPGYESAYVFGAFALAQEGHNFAAAERLLRKGLAHRPSSGPLAFHLGFLYYVRPGSRDLRQAAQWFEQAARQADAPAASARFAAFARQQTGDLGIALEMWREVRDHSENRYLRDIAQRQITEIEAAIQTGRRDRAIRKLPVPTVQVEPNPAD